MSERDISKDENTPHVPEEQEKELNSANDQRNIEEQTPVVESRNSDHGSPPLEGAVGGDAEDGSVKRLSDGDKELIQAGKQDLFKRFFSDEYTQVKTRILERRRHNAERQTARRRHYSDEWPAFTGLTELPALTESPPLPRLPACPARPTSPKLWHFTEIPAVVLNQAGAVIGKTEETEPCLGSENGSALPDFSHVGEGSEHSISSTETALIEDLYAQDFPNRSSLNRRLSLSRFLTLRCPPPPDASDNFQPPHLDDTELTEDLRTCMPTRQRRFGVDESVRSRDEPESLDVTEDLPESSQELTDVPVFSLFPARKISSDSSGDSLDLGDEAENYRPSSENDSCPPMPDIHEGTIEELTQSWESLRISSGIVYDGKSEVEQSQGESPGGAEAENKPDVVDHGHETMSEQSPEGEAEKKPDVVSDQDDVEQETAGEQSPV